MGGALLELVAKGKQDKYLIGNPNTTYFKNIYARHTNFSMESIEINFNENPDFGVYSSSFIEKKGDLLHKIMLEVELPVITHTSGDVSWTDGIGHHLIEYVELKIGGEIIDKVYGDFLDIWSELSTPLGQQEGYYKMVGKSSSFMSTTFARDVKLFIPLPFWFCNDISRSLPLISLQYSDIQICVKFRKFNELWFKRDNNNNPITSVDRVSIKSAKLYCDYVFLDVFERKKFAEVKNTKMLIEQFQISDGHNVYANETTKKIALKFNHPVKELYWVYQSNTNLDMNYLGNYSSDDRDGVPNNSENHKPFKTVELKLNNQDRFRKRHSDYFRLVQPYQFHTRSPIDFIYSYSFALHPERLQPSGSCNFSKIDNSTLILELVDGIKAGRITVYAYSYNVLIIQNGMAGLEFSS